MRSRALSTSKASFMPPGFAPPQPKHLFSGLGSNLISPLRWLIYGKLFRLRLTRLFAGHVVTLGPREAFPRGGFRADACAFRCAMRRPAWRFPARCHAR